MDREDNPSKRIVHLLPPSLRSRVRKRLLWHRFRRSFAEFKALAAEGPEERFSVLWQDRLPCLGDATPTTSYEGSYLYHTAWAARILAQVRPAYHVDISSSLYFCALVSAFIPVRFYDYRPADLRLSNLASQRADLLALPFSDASVASLSCLHVVEHIGLGRYGDPLDPDGDLKAMAELRRVLQPGGSLLLAVPIGKARIAFNAHRIYAYEQVMNSFRDLTLQEFTLIPDNVQEGLLKHAMPEIADAQTYGCGCFWFRQAG